MMMSPSYADLIEAVNSSCEPGEPPKVQSRYSIVLAAAKRARQIVDGEEPLVEETVDKPLSIAVEEINSGMVTIVRDEDEATDDMNGDEAFDDMDGAEPSDDLNGADEDDL